VRDPETARVSRPEAPWAVRSAVRFIIRIAAVPGQFRGVAACVQYRDPESAADPAILVFVHDDVHLLDFYWPTRLFNGLAKFDIIGLAGNRRRVERQPA